MGTNKDEDFIEAANMLHEVISEDPYKESAYYFLGYLYEYGRIHDVLFLKDFLQGLELEKTTKWL